MAKLMAPNIRIDWYPDGHFQDIHNPTVDELNSGVNLSCAVVSGFTLDFADPDTVQITGILNDTISQAVNRSVYEANLQFFLAPRGSSSENERAFRDAERLFYNQHNNIGYLVKRVGYLSHVDYGAFEEQQIDIFKVQADLPKVLSEDGEPVLLDIRFIPQGFAASAVITPWLPPMDAYMWEGTPGDSDSIYYDMDRTIAKRNIIPDPSFEYNHPSYLSSPNTYVTFARANQGYFGKKALELTVFNEPYQSDPQQFFISIDASTAQGKWIGFSYAVKSTIEGFIESQVLDFDLRTDKSMSTEYQHVRSDAIYIPQGVDTLWIWNFLFSNENGLKRALPIGEKIYIDGLQVVVGTSKEDALQQLETYFDGDGEHTQLPPESNNYESPLHWEGEAHNSPSYLELDGQIIARNLVHNPSFEIGTEGWDFESDFDGYGFVLSNNSTVKAGSSLGRVDSNRNGGGTYFTLKISNSALPKIDPSHKWVGGRFFFYAHRNSMGEGNSWVREVSLLDSDKNVLLTDIRESRIPATQDYQSWVLPNIVGAEYVQFKIHFNRVTPNTLNSYQYIDAVQITSSHTFEDLAQQLRIYMDGSTRPESAGILKLTKPSTQYAWLGEPHNSPSVKMVDGVEVARNLDVNGLPHSLDSWVGTSAAVLEFVEDGGQKAIKVSPEEPRTNAFYAWQPDLDLDSDGWVAVRAEVKALDDWVAERFRVVIQGSNTPQTVYERPVEKDKFTEITVTMQVQEGTLRRLYWPTNTTSTDKVGFIIRKSRTAIANTEQEALQQVETYFDGDTV